MERMPRCMIREIQATQVSKMIQGAPRIRMHARTRAPLIVLTQPCSETGSTDSQTFGSGGQADRLRGV